MPNDRLRDVLLSKGLTPEEVAERLGVDPKTVERWITVGRTPYPRYRHAIAVMAGESETYLWPEALPSQRRTEVAQSEIVQVYPHRSSLPAELWDSPAGAGDDLRRHPGLRRHVHDRETRSAQGATGQGRERRAYPAAVR